MVLFLFSVLVGFLRLQTHLQTEFIISFKIPGSAKTKPGDDV